MIRRCVAITSPCSASVRHRRRDGLRGTHVAASLLPPSDLHTRPRRTVLYVPGSNARALAKAATLPVDAVIVDLEDAVAPSAKAEARATALAALGGDARARFGFREILVRVNGVGTPWHADDVAAVGRAVGGRAAAVDGVVLPKAERPGDLSVLAAALVDALAAGAASGRWAPPSPPPALWAMIETARGVLRAADIAAWDGEAAAAAPGGAERPRLAGLIAGTADLAADLRCDGDAAERQALLPSLGAILLAARAARIVALDGVFLDVAATAGPGAPGAAAFAAACAQGAALGFDGKTLVHPSQAAAAQAAFSPTAAAVAHARRVADAWDAAAAAGAGVVTVDGRLVEGLHAAEARALLARHTAAAVREQPAGGSVVGTVGGDDRSRP